MGRAGHGTVTGKVKPCKQKPAKDHPGCAFYNNCKYNHDSNKCRLSFGQDEEDILEID